jgi:hypothetical protein
MARTFERIDDQLVEWIGKQHVFFTATAPSEGGHVNCSPKGLDTLRVLDPQTVAYLDLTGSGSETIAHLRENGRIVIMFCAFESSPRIVRLHGRGEVFQTGTAPFNDLLKAFVPLEEFKQVSLRVIIRIQVSRIADSCGYGVPLMHFEGERPQMEAWTENRLRRNGPDALLEYQAKKNAVSIDGLPGLEPHATVMRPVGGQD